MAALLGTQLAFDFDGRELSAQYDLRQLPPLPPKQVLRLTKGGANYSSKVGTNKADSKAIAETNEKNNILPFVKTGDVKSREKADLSSEKKPIGKKRKTRTVAQIAQERARGRHPAGKKLTSSNSQIKNTKVNAADLSNLPGQLLNGSYEALRSQSLRSQPRTAKTGYTRHLQSEIAKSQVDLDQAWDTLPAGIKIAQNNPSMEKPVAENKALFSANSVQGQKLSMFKTGIANLPGVETKEIVGSGLSALQNDSFVSSEQYIARENETQPVVLALASEADSSIPLVRKLLVGIAVIAVAVGLGSGLGKYLDSGAQDEQWPTDTISYAQSLPDEH